MEKKNSAIKAIQTSQAPKAIGPYSQGIAGSNLVFLSGQLPIDPETGKMVQGTIEDKTHQIFKNIRALARAAGADLDRVVKTTVFLADMNDFAAVNKAYATYFKKNPPARSAVQVAALPLSADIEIESILLLG